MLVRDIAQCRCRARCERSPASPRSIALLELRPAALNVSGVTGRGLAGSCSSVTVCLRHALSAIVPSFLCYIATLNVAIRAAPMIAGLADGRIALAGHGIAERAGRTGLGGIPTGQRGVARLKHIANTLMVAHLTRRSDTTAAGGRAAKSLVGAHLDRIPPSLLRIAPLQSTPATLERPSRTWTRSALLHRRTAIGRRRTRGDHIISIAPGVAHLEYRPVAVKLRWLTYRIVTLAVQGAA